MNQTTPFFRRKSWILGLAAVLFAVSLFFDEQLRFENVGSISGTQIGSPFSIEIRGHRFKSLLIEASWSNLKGSTGQIFKSDVVDGMRLEVTPASELVFFIPSRSPWNGLTLPVTKNFDPSVPSKFFFKIEDYQKFSTKLNDGEWKTVEDHTAFYNFKNWIIGSGAPDQALPAINLNLMGEVARDKRSYHKVIKPLRVLLIIIVIYCLWSIYTTRQHASFFSNSKNKIALFCVIVTVGFALSFIVSYVRGNYYQEKYPANSFLFMPHFHMSDFIGVRDVHRQLDPYSTNQAVYPPLMFLVTYPVTLIGPDHVSLDDHYLTEGIVLCLLFYLSIFLICWNLLSHLQRIDRFQYTFVISTLSYPILFLFDRGNLDLVVYPFSTLGLIYLSQKKFSKATFCLTIATALKLLPGVFLILLFKEKKYRHIAASLAGVVLLNLAAALFLKPTFFEVFAQIKANMSGAYGGWTLTDFSAYFNHSLKSFIRVLDFHLANGQYQEGPKPWHRTYSLFSGATFLVIVFSILRLNLDFWKNVTLLAIAGLLLPLFSPDYKLVALLAPLLIFLKEDRYDRHNLVYVILFALLFTPKDFLKIDFIPWKPYTSEIGVSVLVGPIAMILMLIAIFRGEMCKKQE